MSAPVLALVLALIASVLALVALARAYRPPQQRAVNELLARVGELELSHADLAQRFGKRARIESMDAARAKLEEKRGARQRVEEEAAELLAQQTKQPAAPTDPEQLRAQLRAQLLQFPTKGAH